MFAIINSFIMQFQIYILLGQCMFFYNQYNLANAKAMLGQNIRLANPNEFPSVVTILRYQNSNIVLNRDVVCGGVLISKQDVLTSEHCIINESIRGIIITAGSNNILQASRFYPTWWITYDQWCTQINKPIKHVWNDIAIIRLTTKVGNAIPIATISSVSPDQLIGLQVDAVGWGTMNNGSIALELQTASVKVLNRDECSQLLSALASETIPIEKRQLCTIANPYVLVHEGDSGSPLFYQGAVVGISSGTCPFPNDYFHPNKINIHFVVSVYKRFMKFIKNV